MCFTTATYGARAKKTKSDIVAFKILKGIKQLSSPFQKRQKWVKGQEVEANGFEKKAVTRSINIGLHSFKTLQDARDYKSAHAPSGKIFLARIPAGSYVHTNESQYCSDKLIIENVEYLKK
jgi:hypothetical protein